MFTAAATLLPSLLILRHFVKKDRYPEPTNVLVKTFFLGWARSAGVIRMLTGNGLRKRQLGRR